MINNDWKGSIQNERVMQMIPLQFAIGLLIVVAAIWLLGKINKYRCEKREAYNQDVREKNQQMQDLFDQMQGKTKDSH